MRRSELEHAIRAACDVAGITEITVIGSQAILGQFPDAPRELRQSREVDVFSAVGWCLEVHDLAASKLAAGREKDLEFVAALIAHRMVKSAALAERIDGLPLDSARREHLRRTLAGLRRKG